MEHFNTPAFSPSASCIAPQQQISFTNSSTLLKTACLIRFQHPDTAVAISFIHGDFGDGTTLLHSANPTHVYASAGVYTVSLSTTIEGWNTTCTETYSIQISVGLGVAATQVTNATCFGSDNGSVVAVGSGGAGDYSYSIGGRISVFRFIYRLRAGFICGVRAR
jgi:PKD repeat protein